MRIMKTPPPHEFFRSNASPAYASQSFGLDNRIAHSLLSESAASHGPGARHELQRRLAAALRTFDLSGFIESSPKTAHSGLPQTE